VLGSIAGYSSHVGEGAQSTTWWSAAGALFLPPLLMIVFRQKYPRWWFHWTLELLRFTNRVGVYVALMDDRYPSPDERQGVALELPTPTPAVTSTAGCRWSSGSSPSRTWWCSRSCISGSSSL
jgi:hypothetical protein